MIGPWTPRLAAAAWLVALTGCAGGEPTAPPPQPAPAAGARAAPPAERPSPAAVEAMQRSLDAYRRGDFRGALEAAADALSASPRSVEPYRLMSKLYTDIGRDADGAEYFTRVASGMPDLPHAYFYRGFHELHLNRWEEALASFDRAVEIDPGHPDYRARRGLILELMGDLEGAADAFATAYALAPDSPEHAFRHSKGLRTRGRYDEARDVLETALARSPDAADLHYGLGQLDVRDGRDDEAERSLRRAIELDPAHAKARKELAGLLFRSGREAEARRELAVSARLTDYIRRKSFLMERLGVNRDNALIPLLLAELDLTERRHREALQWFARAEATGGPSDRIRSGRAEALFALGERAAGEAELARVADPQAGRALLARAAALAASGDLQAVAPVLDQAVARAPESRDFLRRASDLYHRAGRDDRAYELLERAPKIPRTPTP